jgi:hypothetical protein
MPEREHCLTSSSALDEIAICDEIPPTGHRSEPQYLGGAFLAAPHISPKRKRVPAIKSPMADPSLDNASG